MEEVKTKVCRKCGETKPVTEFYKHPAAKDGLKGYCIACHHRLAKERRIRNREERKAVVDPNAHLPKIKVLKESTGNTRTVADMTGCRFGRWTVLGISDQRDKYERILWNCRCDCGTERTMNAAYLRSGTTTSCGCVSGDVLRDLSLKKVALNPRPEIAAKRLFNQYRNGAKARGIEWQLTLDDVKNLIFDRCNYCGAEPSFRRSVLERAEVPVNGIDRVDSSKSYETANVVTACTICNLAKKDRSPEEFQEWINQLVDFQLERRSAECDGGNMGRLNTEIRVSQSN